jgi:hypothetical protein
VICGFFVSDSRRKQGMAGIKVTFASHRLYRGEAKVHGIALSYQSVALGGTSAHSSAAPVQTEYARIYNDDSATALVLVQSTATAHTKGFALGEGQEISLSGGAERVPYNKVSVPAPERPVDAVRGGDGMMSEADVLDALEAFRGQGLAVQVDSAAGSWTLRRGDQVDSGTLAMPRRDFIRCAKRMVI